MQRTKEEFVSKITKYIQDKEILEIGCGNGHHSRSIALCATRLTATDPNEEILKEANKKTGALNIEYRRVSAENLPFADKSFDVVVFTASLHHVPVGSMSRAIKEATRVVKKDGFVIFLEPEFRGDFFECEIEFDACDGDERPAKAAAYYAMLTSPNLEEVEEVGDQTEFAFDSFNDFVASMNPKKNLEMLEKFLLDHNFKLFAGRRINIFRVRS